MEGLIKEKRSRLDLTPATSRQRLLVHRCSAYYRLVPETDPLTKNIFVQRTPDSRIPGRRMNELVPPEPSQPPFKIIRRSQGDRRSKPHSQVGSVAREDRDLSDVEPFETGSLGGRSSAAGGSKQRMSIQEREAAYNEARSRIFMGFEEKEKAKERAPSPSFMYASLYEPSPSQQLYDPNQPPNQTNAPYGTQYYHPFAPGLPHDAEHYPPYPGHPLHDQHLPPPDPSQLMAHYPPPHIGYSYIYHPLPPPIQTSLLEQPGPMPPHQMQHVYPMASPPPPLPTPYHDKQPPTQYPYGAPTGFWHPVPGY
ncbi:hypothetical protein BKA70DRAFT_437191 [Coprinopsis sp. MPI-PUGE-AT-0042]|nr:hypothetical protein BKA70DRAFT_437191 [Coprinopsis sp. MPI-PUGE-AT-0042]